VLSLEQPEVIAPVPHLDVEFIQEEPQVVLGGFTPYLSPPIAVLEPAV
jgi:hypothetical protein